MGLQFLAKVCCNTQYHSIPEITAMAAKGKAGTIGIMKLLKNCSQTIAKHQLA